MKKENKKPPVSQERKQEALEKMDKQKKFGKLANCNFTEETICFVSYGKK